MMPRINQTTWITGEDEIADEIAWKIYGNRPDALILLLKANRHLAQMPPVLYAGIKLHLPRLPESSPKPETIVRIFN